MPVQYLQKSFILVKNRTIMKMLEFVFYLQPPVADVFICDDIIELQMFQGCQNWSWISQGVLGSNFIALPGIPGGWAIQQ